MFYPWFICWLVHLLAGVVYINRNENVLMEAR